MRLWAEEAAAAGAGAGRGQGVSSDMSVTRAGCGGDQHRSLSLKTPDHTSFLSTLSALSTHRELR